MHISQSLLSQYDEMVLELHQAKDVEGLIGLAMQGLRRLIPYESGVFFPIHPGTHLFSKPFHVDLGEGLFQQYEAYYQKHDTYRMKIFSQLPIPIVDRCTDFMDLNEWDSNEHRVDFLLPNRMYYLAGVQLLHKGNLVGDISIHRNKRQEDFSDGEMQLLGMYARHVQAVFARLKDNETVMNMMNIQDKMEGGICLFNAKCRQTFVNAQGREIAQTDARGTRFTDREKEILQLLSCGLKNKEIGDTLFISSETVKSHIKSLFHKTGARSRIELMCKIIK